MTRTTTANESASNPTVKAATRSRRWRNGMVA
jgi:hypothetical protein